MRVFIVEDSPVICERLRNMMAGIANIQLVGETDNESDAVRNIFAIQPDVVILDFTLASGNALGVLRRIKEQPLSTWVIVLTNYAYPQYREKCVELGADYFLDKTRGIETLDGLLAKLADGLYLHRESKKHEQ